MFVCKIEEGRGEGAIYARGGCNVKVKLFHHLSVFTEVFQVLLLLIIGSCWRDQPFHVQWKSFGSSRNVSQFRSYDTGRSV